MRSAVNAFNKLVDSNTTKELVEYFKEENEKSREQEKALMQMQRDMQLHMMQILSQSHGSNSYFLICTHSKQILKHVLIMFYVIDIGVNAHNPANNYWSKVKKRNTGKRCTIYSKLTIMTPERP